MGEQNGRRYAQTKRRRRPWRRRRRHRNFRRNVSHAGRVALVFQRRQAGFAKGDSFETDVLEPPSGAGAHYCGCSGAEIPRTQRDDGQSGPHLGEFCRRRRKMIGARVACSNTTTNTYARAPLCHSILKLSFEQPTPVEIHHSFHRASLRGGRIQKPGLHSATGRRCRRERTTRRMACVFGRSRREFFQTTLP